MIAIQKENFKSKPNKFRLEKGLFLGHPNIGSCVQNAFSKYFSVYKVLVP